MIREKEDSSWWPRIMGIALGLASVLGIYLTYDVSRFHF